MRITSKIANFINNSPRTQKVLRNVSESPAVWSTIGAFGVSTTIRPVATMAVGYKTDKQDAIYSACSSVASAFVELFGGMLLLKPMNKSIAKSATQLAGKKGTIFYNNPEVLNRYKSITDRCFKMPTIAVTSLLRFSLVHPISIGLGALGIVKNTERTKQRNNNDKN